MRERRSSNTGGAATSRFDLEDPAELTIQELRNKQVELETLCSALKGMLDTSRSREKKLAAALKDHGIKISLMDVVDQYKDGKSEDAGYGIFLDIAGLFDRAGWLIGLLVFQSCSSFILASNEELLKAHPAIVFFLTMLVGAGGNAGNQAAVKVVCQLALGTVTPKTSFMYICNEITLGLALSILLGIVGFLRSFYSRQTTYQETIAITFTLVVIVMLSIILGVLLPLLLKIIGVDPAHSSTSIQVIMDILGVLIVCYVCSKTLE